VIIGSSLRDKELAQEIADALDDNSRLYVLIVDPNATNTVVAGKLDTAPDRVVCLAVRFEPSSSKKLGTFVRTLANLIVVAKMPAASGGTFNAPLDEDTIRWELFHDGH